MCISNLGTHRPNPVALAFFLQQKEQHAANASAVSDEATGSDRPFVEVEDLPWEKDAAATSSFPAPPKRQSQHHHLTVTHNYHDHANVADNNSEHVPVRGGVATPFPLKLHEMLRATQAMGMEDIVSWQPHGRCFVVHKPKEFVELLPEFFKLSKLASFQRQLNLYGFQRLTQEQDRGGYYHELFLRDREFLSHSIHRVKVKGTGVRARSNPAQEPNFWAMPWVQGSLSLSLVPPVSSITVTPPAVVSPTPLLDAFDKTFHYLDPFQPSSGNWSLENVDLLLEKEADDFFADFEFQVPVQANVEDDLVLGELLEQMMG